MTPLHNVLLRSERAFKNAAGGRFRFASGGKTWSAPLAAAASGAGVECSRRGHSLGSEWEHILSPIVVFGTG